MAHIDDIDLKPVIVRMLDAAIDEVLTASHREHEAQHARAASASFWASIAFGASALPATLSLEFAWDHRLAMSVANAIVAVATVIVGGAFSRRFHRALSMAARATGQIVGARMLVDRLGGDSEKKP